MGIRGIAIIISLSVANSIEWKVFKLIGSLIRAHPTIDCIIDNNCISICVDLNFKPIKTVKWHLLLYRLLLLYKYISDTSQLVEGWLNIYEAKKFKKKRDILSKWRPAWTLKKIGNKILIGSGLNFFKWNFVCYSFFSKETDISYKWRVESYSVQIFQFNCVLRFLMPFVLLFYFIPFHSTHSHDEKKQHSCFMRTLIVFNIFFVIAIALSIAIIYRFGALIKECKFFHEL